MLKEYGIKYEYREYTKNPLSASEIKKILKKAHLKPHDALRKSDRAAKDLRLTGEESAAELIALMAEHPTLLQRPIGVTWRKAVIGRPVEKLLDLT